MNLNVVRFSKFFHQVFCEPTFLLTVSSLLSTLKFVKTAVALVDIGTGEVGGRRLSILFCTILEICLICLEETDVFGHRIDRQSICEVTDF